MVHDYSFFVPTADFVMKKKEHVGFLPDLAISKHQKYGHSVRQPASAPSKTGWENEGK